MNPELLLAHFDRISNAGEAIPCLRRFVLDLAVRGKLVEQDSNDEPVAALLKQNDQVRRAIANKDRRADADRQVLLAAESRWDIPPSWSWCALADLVLFIDYRGKTPTKTEKGVRLITAKNVKKGFINFSPEEFLSEPDYHAWMTRGFPKEGDILFTTEAPMGNAAVVRKPERFALAQRVICFRPYGAVNPDFLSLQFLAEPFQYVLNKTATGLTAKGIKAAKLTRLPIALPPLAEQHRIVSRVQELMALCDRLEAIHSERDTRRYRFSAATHHHLNNGADAETIRGHAKFFIGHLPRLTARPDQIKQLRQTILNLAVSGKLVPQIDKEEPVSILLQRIQTEQKTLIHRRVIKQRIFSTPSPEDEALIDIPQTWQFALLGRLLAFGPQNGISPTASSRPDAPRSITLTATTSGIFKSDYFKQIEANIPGDSEFWLREGDLLFQRGNTREYVGMAAYYDGKPGQLLYPDLIIKVRVSKSVDLRYVHLCSVAPYARAYFSEHASGAQSTMPKINHDILVNLPIPIPPLAEQHRIVAKVDELIAVCDQLEHQVATAQAESRRLLEAVLFHALNDSHREIDKNFAVQA